MKPWVLALYQCLEAQGIPLYGIVDLDKAEERYKNHSQNFEEWLDAGLSAEMKYLRKGLAARKDPRSLMPNAQSVLAFAVPYSARPIQGEVRYARYLRGKDGEDYHTSLKGKAERALAEFRAKEFAIESQVWVDTGPVLERAWAYLCGLGWIGKNNLLIHPAFGSYLYLGVIFLSETSDSETAPMGDRCGHCVRCLEGCPTRAFEGVRTLNANLCISYSNLEAKPRRVSKDFEPLLTDWVAGCDICQEVCPFNRKISASAKDIEAFGEEELFVTDWLDLLAEDEATYRRRVKVLALQYVDWAHFSRNLWSSIQYKLNQDSDRMKPSELIRLGVGVEARLQNCISDQKLMWLELLNRISKLLQIEELNLEEGRTDSLCVGEEHRSLP